HMWGAAFYVSMRDERAALEHAEALGRLAVKQPVWTGIADLNMGQVRLIQGNWEEARRYLRKSIAHLKEIGMMGALPWSALDETECLARQGRLAEALSQVAEVIHDTEELAYLKSPALRQRAKLLARTDTDASAIDGAYRAAIECARSQGARFFELEATTDFAQWLKSQGRAAGARTML